MFVQRLGRWGRLPGYRNRAHERQLLPQPAIGVTKIVDGPIAPGSQLHVSPAHVQKQRPSFPALRRPRLADLTVDGGVHASVAQLLGPRPPMAARFLFPSFHFVACLTSRPCRTSEIWRCRPCVVAFDVPCQAAKAPHLTSCEVCPGSLPWGASETQGPRALLDTSRGV